MRILIYRLGSLGDTVVALPCFRLVRHTHPSAHITVLTNAPVSEKAAPLESILENSGLIDAVIHYPLGLRDPGKLSQLRSTLRERRFDLVVTLAAGRGLAASIRDYLFFKACGIPKVIGLPLTKRDLTCLPRPGEPLLFESEAERLLRRIRKLGNVNLSDRRWSDLGLTQAENTEAKRLLNQAGVAGKFIAASIGTKSPLKDWGTENWRQLFADLGRACPGFTLVLFGSADESESSGAVLRAWEGPRANLCGQTSPRVSAALLREARLFVGHDSGPMHLAAAVGTRCAIVYSAQSPPGQWFPLGDNHVNLYPYPFFQPDRTRDLGHQRKAIASISPGDVVLAITRGLSVDASTEASRLL